jgi:hypothetical protein
MTIINALNFFESLLSKTNKKSEIKIYKDFITVLSNLENRELTDEQYQSIEKELNCLKLNSNPNNKKRYFGKQLNEFKTYLNEDFSLISEGYYTTIGIGIGMSLGVAVGASFGETTGIALGISFGMIIGLVIGRNKDTEAEKQGRVLKTKL